MDEKALEFAINDLLYKGISKKSIINTLKNEYSVNEVKNIIGGSSIPHIINFKKTLSLLSALLFLSAFLTLFAKKEMNIENLIEVFFFIPFSFLYIFAYLNINYNKSIPLQKISFYGIFFFQFSLFAFNIGFSIFQKETNFGLIFISLIIFYYFSRAYMAFPKFLNWAKEKQITINYE
ncbi:hypothetical protein EHQ16_05265 [Leptospira kanakyensis]|uniref:Uncharacterized protein n=1 Tax=Leptospira kanakyensis TaxID=2484968 RepID=A0A6N4PYV9_9LEPT|nr:hypothetical protein [Leptospira kanakyensis]TGK50544.1 hypothetical protein EHQ11_12755 [Leptospira kanakyensis]TGK63855.1 hypothetical protein EHQ16_05265 [Leptospira kanakyensis]TGK69682.1 hypothetical protein EHQ18_12915 [Leptospira kanakyensis]